MRHASLAATPCPIARTLDVVGEWWTLLVVRDALRGARRFEEFKATGIADNILSARLKKLTEAGILKRRRYQTHPDRYEYLLTEKGQALAPVVLALRSWGKRFTKGADYTNIVHTACGGSVEVGYHCTHCDREILKTEVAPVRIDEAQVSGGTGASSSIKRSARKSDQKAAGTRVPSEV